MVCVDRRRGKLRNSFTPNPPVCNPVSGPPQRDQTCKIKSKKRCTVLALCCRGPGRTGVTTSEELRRRADAMAHQSCDGLRSDESASSATSAFFFALAAFARLNRLPIHRPHGSHLDPNVREGTPHVARQILQLLLRPMASQGFDRRDGFLTTWTCPNLGDAIIPMGKCAEAPTALRRAPCGT